MGTKVETLDSSNHTQSSSRAPHVPLLSRDFAWKSPTRGQRDNVSSFTCENCYRILKGKSGYTNHMKSCLKKRKGNINRQR